MIGLLTGAATTLLKSAAKKKVAGAITGRKKKIKKENLLETKSSGGGGGALVRSGGAGRNIRSSSALVKYQAPSIGSITPEKSSAGEELNGLIKVIGQIRSNLSQIRGFIAARKNASLKGLIEHKKSVKLGKAKRRENELETKEKPKGIGSKIKTPKAGFSLMNFFAMVLLGSLLNFLLRHQKTIFKMFDDIGKGLTNIWTAIRIGIISLTTSFPKAIKGIAKLGKALFTSKPARMLGNTLKGFGKSIGNVFVKAGKALGNFIKQTYKNVVSRVGGGIQGGIQGSTRATAGSKALRGKPGGKPANNIRPFKKPTTTTPIPPKATPQPKGLRLAGRARAVFGKEGVKRLSKLGNLFKRIPFLGALLAIGIDLALGERLDNAIAGGIGAGIGAWIGGAIGTGLLPIPFVGTFLGATVGASIGDWFGKQLWKKISGQIGDEAEPPVGAKEGDMKEVGGEWMIYRKGKWEKATTKEIQRHLIRLNVKRVRRNLRQRQQLQQRSTYSGQWSPLLALIRSAEASGNGYNSIAPNDSNPNLSSMTIEDAIKAVGIKGGKGAIGAYQLTSPESQAKAAGLDLKDIFSPENQDKIALAIIKGRGVTLDMVKNNPAEAQIRVAQIWAGLPVPSAMKGYQGRQLKAGDSFYEGYNGNTSTTTNAKVQAALAKVAGGGTQTQVNRRGRQVTSPASNVGPKLAQAAEEFRGGSSAGSGVGRNSCVWAVNQVFKRAGIRPPWGDALYVQDAEKAMIRAGWLGPIPHNEKQPGDVAVCYDAGKIVAGRGLVQQIHIGIIISNGNILSNSSNDAAFAWESSIAGYEDYYRRRGGVGIVKLYRHPSFVSTTPSSNIPSTSTSATSQQLQSNNPAEVEGGYNLDQSLSINSPSSSTANVASTPSTASGTPASVSQQTSYGTGIGKRTVFYPVGNNQTMGGSQSMSVGRVVPIMADEREALNRYRVVQILEFLNKNG